MSTLGKVAGAVFDFLGYLTTLDEPVTLGARYEPGKALEHMGKWFEERNISLSEIDAEVVGWEQGLGIEVMAQAVRSESSLVQYRRCRRMLVAARLNDDEDAEDAATHAMEHLWWQLTDEEQKLIEAFDAEATVESQFILSSLNRGQSIHPESAIHLRLRELLS